MTLAAVASPDDTTVLSRDPGTPGWWLQRLWKELDSRQARYNLLNAYYAGNHRLPEGHRKAREAYRAFQRKARTNYTGLVAESVRERLKIIGIRTGSATTNSLDAVAWRIWQANHFDSRAGLVMLAALVHSDAYVLVIPNPDDKETPILSAKDPRQTITEADPASPDNVRAGLTWWDDDVDQLRHAMLFLPDSVHEFTAKIPRTRGAKFTPDSFAYALTPDGQPRVFPNPTSPDVSLTPFVNRPGLDGEGMGEFEDVIDVQDRINNVILDRLVIAKMQAYRQRWVKGVTLEDEQGVAQQPFTPGSDLIWAVEDPDALFGDFSATDLTPLLKAVDADVRDLAAVTRTPPQYLVGQMVNISGDALKAAESGLVSKVLDRQMHFGESFERVMRLAFGLIGEVLPVDAEVMWADPQFRTLSEVYDAATKASTAGVPWRSRMELLGKTPQEIDRLEAERVADALLMAQYPQLEPAGTPVRYAAAAIPGDATQSGQPELTKGSTGSSGQ